MIKTLLVGERQRLLSYVSMISGAIIGADRSISDRCFVESVAITGDLVAIKKVSLWRGGIIIDSILIGPWVPFFNDLKPKS